METAITNRFTGVTCSLAALQAVGYEYEKAASKTAGVLAPFSKCPECEDADDHRRSECQLCGGTGGRILPAPQPTSASGKSCRLPSGPALTALHDTRFPPTPNDPLAAFRQYFWWSPKHERLVMPF
jgi:hypothetical protein